MAMRKAWKDAGRQRVPTRVPGEQAATKYQGGMEISNTSGQLFGSRNDDQTGGGGSYGTQDQRDSGERPNIEMPGP